MTGDRLWVLLFAPLPLLWMLREWPRSARRLGLALRALSLVAILLALAEPRLSYFDTKVGVTLLADTSASVPSPDLVRASTFAANLQSERGRNWLRILPFARRTRDLTDQETNGDLTLRTTAGEPGRSTDLEAAVREAAGTVPAGMVPRIVLASDGKENLGSVVRAVWQARQLNIPVDTFPLKGRPRPELRLDSIHLPSLVFSGERFAIDLNVVSPRATRATVDLSAEGASIGASEVSLEAGTNLVRLHPSIGAIGAVELTGSIQTRDAGEIHFAQAVSLRRPKLLYVSDDPAGTEANLLGALAAAQFDITRAASLTPSLDAYQVVLLNNQDLQAIPSAAKAGLEAFVQQGGGLLVIGGERNVYVEDQQKIEDPLDRALPAKLAPPRSPEGTCVVLIVDKSSSMEGKKMELARLAAIGVVENLRPIDQVGVLMFDNTYAWAVPIRRAEDRTLIKRLIASITPDGGTQIAPALAEAFHEIAPVQATFKHIVLLTDGISEEGDSITLAQEALARKVTISTVGLGQDVNRAYLERVASTAAGKSYFLVDPSNLQQILLRDVMEHTGSTAVEKPLSPIVNKNAEILEGVGMDSAPTLSGYVRFIPKPSADLVLSLEKDPLLVRWQYGLGRSAIFTSDAKSRWAAGWVGWKGFDRFWANVVRDLLPHAQPAEASLAYDSTSGDLVAQYQLSRRVPEPAAIPDIFALGPNGFRQPLDVRKIAPGSYQGRIHIGNAEGLFRVRPLEDSRAFPEIGYYRQEAELNDYGADTDLLRRIAEFTGGHFNPAPGQVFDAGGRSLASSMSLWPGLLALAVLLSLAELLNRKWKGVAEVVRGMAQSVSRRFA